jgi:alkanesulfonate monooxygenase SsuD/methylene tetrahydromethanopterin reductase-like flavin-dependent oxidoreductase (luciferase family)
LVIVQHGVPKIGVVLPLEETHMAGMTARWSDLVAMAAQAEAVGFASVWTSDHLVLRNPGEPTHGVWEGWTMLAALAARTERVEIGTQVTAASFRNPGLLARMADTVDEISGGRLILGLGAGDHRADYEAFGFPFEERFRQAAEYIPTLAGLLRTGRSDHHGTYFHLERAEMPLRGPRLGGPPIVVAGEGPRMLRLAAENADGWMIFDKSLSEARALDAAFRDACIAAGRESLEVDRYLAGVVVAFPGAVGVPWSRAEAVVGDAATQARRLLELGRAGFGTILVWPDPNDVRGIEAMAPVLEFVAHSSLADG